MCKINLGKKNKQNIPGQDILKQLQSLTLATPCAMNRQTENVPSDPKITLYPNNTNIMI